MLAPAIWAPVRGYEDAYAVSTDGSVMSLKRGILRRPATDPDGYRRLVLRRRGECRNAFVHRLVAEAFVGGMADGLEVNHKDGDRANNAASNLEWVTREQNVAHALPNYYGRHWKVLTPEQRAEIRASRKPRAQLAEEYGVNIKTIKSVRRERTETED